MADRVASEEDIKAYISSPAESRIMSPALKGVLVETALTGRLRYQWPLVQVLLVDVMQRVLLKFEEESVVEVGPSPAGDDAEGCRMKRDQLLQQLRGWTRGAPFTLQRVCEVVLEPWQQYRRFDKLAQALDKLLRVTSVVDKTHSPPPLPHLNELGPVNENPLPSSTSSQGNDTDAAMPAGDQLANGQPGPSMRGGGVGSNVFMSVATPPAIAPTEEGGFMASRASSEARRTPAFDDPGMAEQPGSPTHQTAGGPGVIGLEDVGSQPGNSGGGSPQRFAPGVTSIPQSPPRQGEEGGSPMPLDRSPPPRSLNPLTRELDSIGPAASLTAEYPSQPHAGPDVDMFAEDEVPPSPPSLSHPSHGNGLGLDST